MVGKRNKAAVLVSLMDSDVGMWLLSYSQTVWGITERKLWRKGGNVTLLIRVDLAFRSDVKYRKVWTACNATLSWFNVCINYLMWFCLYSSLYPSITNPNLYALTIYSHRLVLRKRKQLYNTCFFSWVLGKEGYLIKMSLSAFCPPSQTLFSNSLFFIRQGRSYLCFYIDYLLTKRLHLVLDFLSSLLACPLGCLCVTYVKMLWPEQVKVNLGGVAALSLLVKSS